MYTMVSFMRRKRENYLKKDLVFIPPAPIFSFCMKPRMPFQVLSASDADADEEALGFPSAGKAGGSGLVSKTPE